MHPFTPYYKLAHHIDPSESSVSPASGKLKEAFACGTAAVIRRSARCVPRAAIFSSAAARPAPSPWGCARSWSTSSTLARLITDQPFGECALAAVGPGQQVPTAGAGRPVQLEERAMLSMPGRKPLRGDAQLHSRFAVLVACWFCLIAPAAGVGWPNNSARRSTRLLLMTGSPWARSTRRKRPLSIWSPDSDDVKLFARPSAGEDDLVDRWSRVPPGRGCRRIPSCVHLIARCRNDRPSYYPIFCRRLWHRRELNRLLGGSAAARRPPDRSETPATGSWLRGIDRRGARDRRDVKCGVVPGISRAFAVSGEVPFC